MSTMQDKADTERRRGPEGRARLGHKGDTVLVAAFLWGLGAAQGEGAFTSRR